jgi:hypothetical protein
LPALLEQLLRDENTELGGHEVFSKSKTSDDNAVLIATKEIPRGHS